MTKVDQLLEQAKQLSRKEQQELARKLRHAVVGSRSRRVSGPGPYAALLELAGATESEARDVSRNKKRHLGAIYRRRAK